jgi:tetratricopeptide (TPR) repeat protein
VLSEFEDAVKKDPSDSTSHYHLGLTYHKLNESNRARPEIEKAIAINPRPRTGAQARRPSAKARRAGYISVALRSVETSNRALPSPRFVESLVTG